MRFFPRLTQRVRTLRGQAGTSRRARRAAITGSLQALGGIAGTLFAWATSPDPNVTLIALSGLALYIAQRSGVVAYDKWNEFKEKRAAEIGSQITTRRQPGRETDAVWKSWEDKDLSSYRGFMGVLGGSIAKAVADELQARNPDIYFHVLAESEGTTDRLGVQEPKLDQVANYLTEIFPHLEYLGTLIESGMSEALKSMEVDFRSKETLLNDLTPNAMSYRPVTKGKPIYDLVLDNIDLRAPTTWKPVRKIWQRNIARIGDVQKKLNKKVSSYPNSNLVAVPLRGRVMISGSQMSANVLIRKTAQVISSLIAAPTPLSKVTATIPVK